MQPNTTINSGAREGKKNWIHLTIHKGLSTIQLGTIHKESGIPNQSREKLNFIYSLPNYKGISG